jgi:hypothetical protein
MAIQPFDRVFPTDILSKRERVERTLNHQPVDRAAIHDQVSFNPGVISLYTGKRIEGFAYTREDIGTVIRKTLDACFPPFAPSGTDRVTDDDGFVIQRDNWTHWTVSRPFADVPGAREHLVRKTTQMRNASFDADRERSRFRRHMEELQHLVGDAVIIDYSVQVGFCTCWYRLGLELFTYLYQDDPQVVTDYIETYTDCAVRRLHAIADRSLSPVVLIAEDFATKQGPIFSPELLRREHFPRVKRLTDAWHSHGLKVLYHSDGNWGRMIPDLVDCGLDGFYCLEPSNGMDIIALRQEWPEHVWAGGVDGVDLMERGTPDQVARAVHRQILETDVLNRGGLFVGTSSEINPPIKPENYRAMIEAVGEILNPEFVSRRDAPD